MRLSALLPNGYLKKKKKKVKALLCFPPLISTLTPSESCFLFISGTPAAVCQFAALDNYTSHHNRTQPKAP